MAECNECFKEVGSIWSHAGEPGRCLSCIEKDGERQVACEGCGHQDQKRELIEHKNAHYCDGCYEMQIDAEHEAEADRWHDPHGYYDVPQEVSDGWAMQDRIDMYRNEY